MPRRTHRSKVVVACLAACLCGVGLLGAGSAAADEVDALQRARYEAVQKLIAGKRHAAARPIARLIVVDQPTWSGAWVLLGVTYTDDPSNYDLAEAAFDKAAELEKTSPEPLRNLAALEVQRGDPEDAANYLEKAADLAHDDHSLQITAAHALRAVRRIEEAKERFQIVLDDDPQEVRALTGLGALHVDLGEYSQAIAIYQNAMDAGATSPLLFNNLADALVRAARYDEAIAVADKGVALRDDPGLHIIRGRALIRKGNHAEAEATLSKVADFSRKGDQIGVALYHLGNALALQGCNVAAARQCGGGQPPACCDKDRKALEAYTAAAKATDRLDDIDIRVGLAQFAVGQLEDAEATLREHVDTQGDKVEAEAFGALAVTLFGFGEPRDIDEAVRLYRDAAELAADFEDIDRLVTFRQWPPQAVEVIRELRTRANLARPIGAPPDARGCSCAVATTERGDDLRSSLLLGAAVLLVGAWRRRTARASQRGAHG